MSRNNKEYQKAYREANREKLREYHREYRKSAAGKKADKEYKERSKITDPNRRKREWLKSKYNLTWDEYIGQIEAQVGRCALCNKPMGDDIVVDHCHTTGQVRELLHSKCNLGLGHYDDDPERLRQAADYLERNQS